MDIHAIKEHFDNEFPREGCGVLSVIKGKKKWFPITNISPEPDNFILDSDEFFWISNAKPNAPVIPIRGAPLTSIFFIALQKSFRLESSLVTNLKGN